MLTSPKLSEFHKKLENLLQRFLAPEKKQSFCSSVHSVVIDFPVPVSTQKLAKRPLKGGNRGIKKLTQPTIAHDETHECGKLICCSLCKSTRCNDL